MQIYKLTGEIMTWIGEKQRHSMAKRHILTANGHFLELEDKKRQTVDYTEYIINEYTIHYIENEDLEEIYNKSRINLVIIHYPELMAKMFINKNRIGYEEIIYELPIYDNYKERDNVFYKIKAYEEIQKIKGFEDNIYRKYSINYNDKTKHYEVKMELIGDAFKETSKNDFKKVMFGIEEKAIQESITAKKFLDELTMRNML